MIAYKSYGILATGGIAMRLLIVPTVVLALLSLRICHMTAP